MLTAGGWSSTTYMYLKEMRWPRLVLNGRMCPSLPCLRGGVTIPSLFQGRGVAISNAILRSVSGHLHNISQWRVFKSHYNLKSLSNTMLYCFIPWWQLGVVIHTLSKGDGVTTHAQCLVLNGSMCPSPPCLRGGWQALLIPRHGRWQSPCHPKEWKCPSPQHLTRKNT
jgi:hypothetical protein